MAVNRAVSSHFGVNQRALRNVCGVPPGGTIVGATPALDLIDLEGDKPYLQVGYCTAGQDPAAPAGPAPGFAPKLSKLTDF